MGLVDELIQQVLSECGPTPEAAKRLVAELRRLKASAYTIDWALKKLDDAAGTELSKHVCLKAREPQPCPDDWQVKKLFQYAKMKDPLLALAIGLMATGGLRIGEVCNLEWDDLELRSWGGLRIHVAEAKMLSRRWAFARPEVAELAEDLMRRRKDAPKPWPYTQNYLYMRFRKLADEIGVQRVHRRGLRTRVQVHPHSLRSWFYTKLVSAGCPVMTAEQLMGHAVSEYFRLSLQQLEEEYRRYCHALTLIEEGKQSGGGVLLLRPDEAARYLAKGAQVLGVLQDGRLVLKLQ